MVKHTQIIRQQKPTNYFSVFDHFVGLELWGLRILPINHAQAFMQVDLPKLT